MSRREEAVITVTKSPCCKRRFRMRLSRVTAYCLTESELNALGDKIMEVLKHRRIDTICAMLSRTSARRYK